MRLDKGGSPNRKRWKKWLLLATTLAAVTVLAWQGFKQYLNIQSYIPIVTGALTDATGLPASIERFDVSLLPTPHATMRNIVLGEGDFKLEVSAVDIHVRLTGLLHRELDITSIHAQPAVLHLPGNNTVLTQRVSAVSGHAGGAPKPPSESPAAAPPAAQDGKTRVAGFTLNVRLVALDEISIYRDGVPQFTGRAELRDLLSTKITAKIAANATAISKDAQFAATATITMASGEKPKLEGSLSLEHADITDVLKDEGIPHARVSVGLAFAGVLPDSLKADLTGTLETEASKSFSGTLGGQAVWKDGLLVLSNVAMDSPGLKTAATASFRPGGALSATLSSATAQGDGLRVLLAYIPIPGFHFAPRDNAVFSLSGLEFGTLPEGGLGLLKGEAALEGIDLVDDTQGTVLGPISAAASVTDNVLNVRELRSEGLVLSGRVHPDLGAQKTHFEFSGEADLADGRLRALVPTNSVSETGGRLLVRRCSFTLAPNETLPPDFQLDGSIREGRFKLTTPAYTDQFAQLTASFGFNGNRIAGKIAAHSDRLGALSFDGQYVPAEWLLKGMLHLDMPTAAASLLPEGPGRDYAMPLAERLGNSAFDLSLRLPGGKEKSFRLQMDRQGSPPLHGTLELGTAATGTALKHLDVSGEVPLDSLASALPIPVQTEGAADVSVKMDETEPGILINADLGKATLRLNEYIAKKPGDPATVSARMDPSQTMPVQSVQINLLGETATLQQTTGTLGIPALKLNLASLSPLLAQGGQFSGRVSGRVDFAPLDAQLHLDGAGLQLGPGVAIDAVTGNVIYRNGAVRCESLRVLGADSDCTLTATLENRVLDASVTGEKLNLSALLAMQKAFATTAPTPAPQNSPPPSPESGTSEKTPDTAPDKRMTGKATVHLGALFYQRARMDSLHADVAFSRGAMSLSNLVFQASRGTARGGATLTYGSPNMLEVSLDLSGVDLDLVDRLAFAESREMRGAMTGPLRLRLPLTGAPALYGGLNGSVDVKIENGTYGKIRLATELLTLLKSTEIVRLTIPKLKDEGLTFKSSDIVLRMTDGRVAVQKFTITDNAYAIDGAGTINLPADDMDVTLGFNPLQSVTGVAGKVPGVKLATGLLSSGTGLRIRATGSPFNPKVRPEAGVLPIRSGDSGAAPTEKPQGKPAKGLLNGLLKPFR